MTCSNGEVAITGRSSYERQSIRRNRPQPRTHLIEFFLLKLQAWVMPLSSPGYGLNPFLSDIIIDSGEFHGACKTGKTLHWSNGYLGLCQNGRNRNICLARDINTVALSSLQRHSKA